MEPKEVRAAKASRATRQPSRISIASLLSEGSSSPAFLRLPAAARTAKRSGLCRRRFLSKLPPLRPSRTILPRHGRHAYFEASSPRDWCSPTALPDDCFLGLPPLRPSRALPPLRQLPLQREHQAGSSVDWPIDLDEEPAAAQGIVAQQAPIKQAANQVVWNIEQRGRVLKPADRERLLKKTVTKGEESLRYHNLRYDNFLCSLESNLALQQEFMQTLADRAKRLKT